MPTLLRLLRDEAPNASIRCVSLRPYELKDAMADGSLDLAVGYFPDLAEASFFQQNFWPSFRLHHETGSSKNW
ncbi:hypothetical protein HFN54_25550 [Rhizobium leguminosarum]|nr:hypothetical protein [Rhizobium leguminosarum]